MESCYDWDSRSRLHAPDLRRTRLQYFRHKRVTQEDANYLIMLRYIVYVAAQLIHLFCLSFEGQKLIDHSLQTRDTIYNCPWYKMPIKYQRMLLFVMRKSLQPIFLSAGKMYIFSLENFTTIVQTSMSYFTVLSSLE